MSNYLSSIHSDNFESKALEIFEFQAKKTPIYKRYIDTLGINTSRINSLEKIPFLPVDFFKSNKVYIGNKKPEIIFESSGTTGTKTSKHFIQDLKIYEEAFKMGFEEFYGSPDSYCFLALLPSYLEKQGSSLIYMCNALIKESKHPDSGFYLHNLQELANKLRILDDSGQKTILLGVSYALLNLIEEYHFSLKNTIIMETGGMKGKRKEMIKDEFYQKLKSAFGVNKIHSEYGMTELLSQAYSFNNGKYHCPKWMRVLIRDINDPFCFLPKNTSGGINIIDLANINSCSFISCQDLGKINKDGSFSVLGRFDYSNVRGCNLMVR